MSAKPRPDDGDEEGRETDRAGRVDPDSRARTHLASERTSLAWLRPGRRSSPSASPSQSP